MKIRDLKEFINEQIILAEIANTKKETKFEERIIPNGIEYLFKTDSGNEYTLQFFHRMLSTDSLIGDQYLENIVDSNYFKYGRIGCVAIGYTLVAWGKDPERYDGDTGLFEGLELINRIAHMIDNYKSKHNSNNIYIVGNEKGDERRLKFYELLYFIDHLLLFYRQYLNVLFY
jgi:hypothetical protein